MAGTSVSPFFSVRRPLAACIASAFALAAPASALAVTVTSCLDDGGPGTLRSVIAAAAEGATIDFAGLNCTAVSSKITLSGGSIPVARNSLTIDGSGATSRVTVDASSLLHGYYDNRVFTHSGNGTLSLKGFDVTGGYILHYTLPSSGGCIASAGNVALDHVTVSNCTIKNIGPIYQAIGGAIDAAGDVTLQSSTVSYSSAAGAVGAKGAGVFANNVTLTASTVSHNAGSSSGSFARGGGVYANVNLISSSLSILSYNTLNAYGAASGAGAYAKGDITNGNSGFGSFIYSNSATSAHSMARGGGAFTLSNFGSAVQSYIKYNSVSSAIDYATGGGLYVAGNLTFYFGNISGNTAGSTSGIVRGGGARVLGPATFKYTTISGNKANNFGFGGGLHAAGNTLIRHSTISGNSAGFADGGLEAFSLSPGALLLRIESSTVSDNTTPGVVGGLYTNFGQVKFYNSTIAFNSAGNGSTYSPGVHLTGPSTALLQNTLMSNNHVGTADDDLTTSGGVIFDAGSSTNLIRVTPVSNLPPGSTTFGLCPLLGSLRSNGGLTYTRALLSKSPAIDHGGPTNFAASYDQRGSQAVNETADYPRISGPVADIGAYEVQQNDIIFNSAFEGCNLLL